MSKKVITIFLEVFVIVMLVVFVVFMGRVFSKLDKTSPFEQEYIQYTSETVIESVTVQEVTDLVTEISSEGLLNSTTQNTSSELDELDYMYLIADIVDDYNPRASSFSEYTKVNYCIQNILDFEGYEKVKVTAGEVDTMQDIIYFSCEIENGNKWFVYYQVKKDKAYAIKDNTITETNAEYEQPYELFPYQISLGVLEQEVVLEFFDDGPTYYGLKKNLESYGGHVLESLYNICIMYNYVPSDLEIRETSKVTGDNTLLFEYDTPNGLLTLVVDTINARAYFTMGTLK